MQDNTYEIKLPSTVENKMAHPIYSGKNCVILGLIIQNILEIFL